MQIQCPHCKSRYRLGSEMIDAYGGFVRCGNCNYKFNIHDQVILDEERGELHNTSKRPAAYVADVKQEASTTAGTHSTRIEPRLEGNEQEDEFNVRFGRNDIDNEAGTEPSEYADDSEPRLEPAVQSSEQEAAENVEFPESLEDSDHLRDDHFNELPDNTVDDSAEQALETDDPEEDKDTAELESWPALESSEEPVLFESLDDDELEEDPARLELINDDVDDVNSVPGFFSHLFHMVSSAVKFLFWAATAVGLTYLLIGQVKGTLYPAYKNHSFVQKMRSVACGYLPCDDSAYNLDLFEIVVSRMDEVSEPARQLHISIFLLNKAEHAQIYPNILLTLKTIDGSTVGQRVFSPEEYFTSYDSLISSSAELPASSAAMIKPNKLGKILLKLDKPPANAVGFEARVAK